MFGFMKRHEKRAGFDAKILRKNDISLLILDERWNSLFTTTEKTPEILKCEEKIREYLKEQSRLISESKEIAARKKELMDKILKLTTEAYENNNLKAKEEMQSSEKEIVKINERLKVIGEQIESMPGKIGEANLELLEHTVTLVYFGMKRRESRVRELVALIEETKGRLKEYIGEKESLAQDNTDVYTYFHDLIGGEELERLDEEYFGDK